MPASSLNQIDARRLAAFVLGIDMDAGDHTALRAFRLLSAQHHPDHGGDRALYGAVLGAWSTWVSTSQLAPAAASDDDRMLSLEPTAVARHETLELVALAELEQAIARRMDRAHVEPLALSALDQPGDVEDDDVDDGDVLIIIDEPAPLVHLDAAGLAAAHVQHEARQLAALPAPHRAYRTTGHRPASVAESLRA